MVIYKDWNIDFWHHSLMLFHFKRKWNHFVKKGDSSCKRILLQVTISYLLDIAFLNFGPWGDVSIFYRCISYRVLQGTKATSKYLNDMCCCLCPWWASLIINIVPCSSFVNFFINFFFHSTIPSDSLPFLCFVVLQSFELGFW